MTIYTHGQALGADTPDKKAAPVTTPEAAQESTKNKSNFIAPRAMLARAKGSISKTTLIDLMIFAQAAQFGVLLAMLVLGSAA